MLIGHCEYLVLTVFCVQAQSWCWQETHIHQLYGIRPEASSEHGEFRVTSYGTRMGS